MEFIRRDLDHPDVQSLVAEVQDYYRGLYGGGDDSPMDAAEFTPPAGAFFVGYLDRTPVATGAWRRRVVSGLPGPVAELKRMFVTPTRQGQGLGRQMLAFLESDAAHAGIAALVLQTGTLQTAAVRMYRAGGYGPLPADADISWDPYVDSEFSRRLWRRAEVQ